MMLGGMEREAGLLLGQTDYFRRSAQRLGGTGPHKEWQHFIAHTDALHLLVNFSLLDDAFRTAERETGRVIVLARTPSGWVGGVDTIAANDLHAEAGSIDARFGSSSVTFDGRAYRVMVRMQQPKVTMDLRFVPSSLPALCPNQPLSHTETLSWLFVPRLVATGTVEIEGQSFEVTGAAAYHDHNWGVFRWGDDFTWEWSSVLPAASTSPWSAVYMRLTDRRRGVARCQGFYVWREWTHRKIFRDHEIRVAMDGRFQPAKYLKIPRVMALLAPGLANDVPSRMTITAGSDADEVRLVFDLEDLCQVIVPDETNLRSVVTLNEATGVARMRGTIDGELLEMEGPCVFEFIR
jgi:hypothetical protein